MIWTRLVLLSCAAAVSIVQNGKSLEDSETTLVTDTSLLTQLDTLWEEKQETKDFEKKCNAVIKFKRLPDLDLYPVKRYARDSPFQSVWLNRKILFHTKDSAKTGIRVPGAHAPLNLQWDVTNRFKHQPHSEGETNQQGIATCEGGCTYGAGVDKMTNAQVIGDVLYSIEKPTNFEVKDLYRGQVTQATVDVVEWFAWHGISGKYALRLTYREEMHHAGSPVPPAKVGHERETMNLFCDLYYKPQGGTSARVEKTFWQVSVQSVKEHGHVKSETLTC